MPAGRPTTYKPEFCEMLIEHMSKGFSYQSFAGKLKVNQDTLYNWEKLFPEFSETKKTAQELSRQFWEKQGIDGLWEVTEYDEDGKPLKTRKLNSTVWIFNMKNRFAWADRTEVTDTKPKTITLKYNIDDKKPDEPTET